MLCCVNQKISIHCQKVLEYEIVNYLNCNLFKIYDMRK